ncbi:hypothetical protein WSM22_08980 [Cytophagales bacterium WSM2-2]|nr:hypothetical protein WSM22_08980 [Cytophagales bacterium WSM2-2]
MFNHIFKKKNSSVRTISIDSSTIVTDLCSIGAKYNTDKSPYSVNSVCARHRKGYTAVYEILLGQLRNKPINFCEIGIEAGASLQAFSEYFTRASIFGMEYSNEKIVRCQNLMIPRTTILNTDVNNPKTLDLSFQRTQCQFDIIIDDSSHVTDSQLNIIEVATQYLKQGGILIIEDLFRKESENVFASLQSFINKNFSFHSFIICHHDNRNSWDNDKIWYGIKR